jgi:hypothetical protein
VLMQSCCIALWAVSSTATRLVLYPCCFFWVVDEVVVVVVVLIVLIVLFPGPLPLGVVTAKVVGHGVWFPLVFLLLLLVSSCHCHLSFPPERATCDRWRQLRTSERSESLCSS